MGQLHDRNCRRAFAPAEAFQADALPSDRFQSEIQVGGTLAVAVVWRSQLLPSVHIVRARSLQAGTAAGKQLTDTGSSRAWGLLSYAPFLVPFRERAKLFQAVVAQARLRATTSCPVGAQRQFQVQPNCPPRSLAQERARYRDMEAMSMAHEFGMTHHFYPIRRTQVHLAMGLQAKYTSMHRRHALPMFAVLLTAAQVLQDAFEHLNGAGDGMHGRIRIQVSHSHGGS